MFERLGTLVKKVCPLYGKPNDLRTRSSSTQHGNWPDFYRRTLATRNRMDCNKRTFTFTTTFLSGVTGVFRARGQSPLFFWGGGHGVARK